MKTKDLTYGAVIAALYVVLTFITKSLGLQYFRVSEALTVLPCFIPSAVPGLFVGCLLSNILTGCALWDIIFGSIATLIGAFGSRIFRKNKYFAILSPIVCNTMIIPFVIKYSYGAPKGIWILFLTVGFSELISCGFLGLFLYNKINKKRGL